MSEKSIKQEFESLHAKKQSILSRCEDYADVTLPYVFPRVTSGNPELQTQLNSTGARGVNHITNKLILTLFPENQPFFRLSVSNSVVQALADAAKERGDQIAIEALSRIDTSLANKERACIQKLGYTKFRTEATSAARLLVVTGNACMYHPVNDAPPQVYSLRDYCVQRDLSGTVINLLTRDTKAFGTFNDTVQAALQSGRKTPYKSTDQVTLYTKIELGDDTKYHLTQAIEGIPLDSTGTFTSEELPWKVLSWNLVRGEDYGHGHVEDYYGALHALCMLSTALVTGTAVAAEIKFLIDPASTLDPKALNEAASGSYHQGRKDDVTCVQLDKALDFQMVNNAIARLEQQIALAFMLNSAVTRDAERVTAEEIRYVAQELDVSNAGIYSRLALEWQYPTAVMLLAREGTKITAGSEIQPQIITGIDALSRAGDLDNLRAAIADMSSLNSVPEGMQQALDPLKLWEFVCARRGVEYMKFTKPAQQIQAEQQAVLQQQQALQANQARMNIAESAAGAAINKGM